MMNCCRLYRVDGMVVVLFVFVGRMYVFIQTVMKGEGADKGFLQ